MADVDLRGVRLLTPAELSERRHRKSQGRPRKPPKIKPKKLRFERLRGGRKTVVATISIPPELKYRAMAEFGEGSFTKAVIRLLRQALLEVDEKRAKSVKKT